MVTAAQTGGKPKPKPKTAAVTKAPVKTMDQLQSDILDQYNAGEWAQVIELANAIQKQKPRDTAVNTRKAIAYAMLGNKEMAAKTVTTFYPDPEAAATLLSALPTKLADDVADRDALWYTDEAIRIAPKSTYGYMLKAAYLVDDSNYAEALTTVRKAWDLSSDSLRLVMVGVLPGIEQRAGGGPEAYDKIERMRKANPKSNEVAKAYYLMLVYDKRYEDALAVAGNALEFSVDAQERYWHKERGYLYRDMGRAKEACEEAKWLIAKDPEVYEDMLDLLQCPEAYAELRPAAVKEYVYGVEFNGTEYDFVVTPGKEDISDGFRFDFRMTNETETAGHITIAKGAMDTAREQMNMFASGDQTLTQATTVWISPKVFQEIKSNGETRINATGEMKTFRLVDAEDQQAASDFFSPGVGNILDLKENGVKKKTRVLHIASEDGEEHIWINDDEKNPLIVAMNLGWLIGLRETTLK